jgi:glycosyltransferase involved in cell wall biosynthesis
MRDDTQDRAWLARRAGAATEATRQAAGYARSAARMARRRLRRLAGGAPLEVGQTTLAAVPGRDTPADGAGVRPVDGPRSPLPVGEPPLISVIMPVYNALRSDAGYLRAALDSIAAQGYPNLELVVVDDGSSDGSMAAVGAFFAAHPDLRVSTVSKTNGGQSSARTAGAAAATGEWLAFLDQDDIWLPDRLVAVSGELRDGVDLVYTDADTVDAAGELDRGAIHALHGLGGRHPITDLEGALYRDVFVMPGVMTVRTAFYRALGGFDEGLSGYEDDDLFVRAVEAGHVAYVPVVTLKWRLYEGNYSQSHRMVASRLAYWRKLMSRYGGSPEAARRISRRFYREFLLQCSGQLDNEDPLARANLSGARALLPDVGVVDRIAFAVTAWAWTRRGRAAYYARWWLLNGMAAAA